MGRRHPDHDAVEPGTDAAAKAGPKYLNTGETVLFAKGEQLYGLAEHTDRLEGGATPVIVEGPLDALAVSLASPGHVGVAPLGTALTDSQADSLIPYLRSVDGVDGSDAAAGPIVATDADLAGQMAAERDYWMLTARGADPRHLAFPPGHDPASLLARDGAAALAGRLTTATRPLAQVLVDERLNHLPAGAALPAAAAVVAAGQADRWADSHPRPGSSAARPARRGPDRAGPPDQPVGRRPARRQRTADPRRATGPGPHRRQDQLTPMQRWAPLLRQVDPRLVRDDSWAPLAAAVDQANRAGHDLPTLLREVLNRGPLDPGNPSLDLQSRLLAGLEPEPVEWRRPRQDRLLNPFAVHQQPRRPAPPSPRIRPAPTAHRDGDGPGNRAAIVILVERVTRYLSLIQLRRPAHHHRLRDGILRPWLAYRRHYVAP